MDHTVLQRSIYFDYSYDPKYALPEWYGGVKRALCRMKHRFKVNLDPDQQKSEEVNSDPETMGVSEASGSLRKLVLGLNDNFKIGRCRTRLPRLKLAIL